MKQLNAKIHLQFQKMCETGKLFKSNVTGSKVWETYLNSFTEENNPIFRDPNSSTHNCNLCNNFIRRYGNILAIDENYKVLSLFDNIDIDGEYKETVAQLSKLLKNSKVENVFFETASMLNKLAYGNNTATTFRLGVAKNVKRYTKDEALKYGGVKENQIMEFNHFHLDLPKKFVTTSSESLEEIQGKFRDDKNVFQRGMEEISVSTLELVRDLITQGSLLNGDTYLNSLLAFLELKKEHETIPFVDRENWYWIKSYKLPFAKFKNTLIGTLCSEIEEGLELEKCCLNWNKRADPINYMKVTAPITEKQKKADLQFLVDNGYETAFDRRFAVIDDIKVSEILHTNSGNTQLKKVSIFDDVKVPNTENKKLDFSNVPAISIDKFMQDILPNSSNIELYLENRFENNMVSLTTSNSEDCKPIFKWDNNFSWTYKNNLAGKSQIKEEVKLKGGKVDGVLRFSMMWADGNGDNSDLDLHCKEPSGEEIYYGHKVSYYTKGNLDIDITRPNGKLSVENITYPSLNLMRDGVYKLFIHQYSNRNSKGFKAEIEFEGELYSYTYEKPVYGVVEIANVTLKNGKFEINHLLAPTNEEGISKEVYRLKPNNFHKVNLVCLSPNYWNENPMGNKHYFFMLNGCKTTENIRGFHIENLKSDLLQAKRTLELFGTQKSIPPSDLQLSGVGFNSTVSDEFIVKVDSKLFKIKI